MILFIQGQWMPSSAPLKGKPNERAEKLRKKRERERVQRPNETDPQTNLPAQLAGQILVAPADAGPPQDTIPTAGSDSNEQWFPVKQIVRKRGRGRQTRYQVIWDDPQEKMSWVKPADLTDFCKREFRMAQASKRRRPARRS